MSTTARLISGSAASWGGICTLIISQVVLVPLYLSHWAVGTYGTWLAIQALAGLLVTVDLGHQEFLGFEFMRLGKDKPLLLGRFLWSGMVTGIGICFFQLLLIVLFLATDVLPHLLGIANGLTPALTRTAGILLLLQGLAWLLGSSITGLLFRVLAPFGYYPRMAWWNFFSAIVGSAASVTAVVRGAGLLEVGLVSTGTTVVLSIPLYFDLLRLVRKERIPFSPPSWQIAKTNFLLSLALSGKILLDNMRQQGVRIVLAPLSGLAGLAAFSTMRTGANGALQGLNSITQPLMPDLVRFLQQRDQARSESAFGTIWLLVIAVMAPAAVVLQALVEPIYLAWTRGQIPFNPGLFALLSLSVLVYAVVQPAMTVVVGNNLLKPQLALSVLGALIMVGGMFILVPATGILGAGLALLAAEIVTTLGYKIVAQRWLHQNGLQWPGRSFRIALSSVVIAATAMALMLWLPRAKWFILAGSLSFFWVNVRRYWLVLPAIATQHTLRLISKLPGLRGLAPG